MAGNHKPKFKVGHVTKAKEQVTELLDRAVAAGIAKDVAAALTSAMGFLESSPLVWGEPHYHTHLQGGTVRSAVHEGLAFEYVVYEHQRIVLLLAVIPLGNHPLGRE
jgi:hypothetical protein